MLKNNISCQLHYPYSLNRVGALKNRVKSLKLPISEKWAKECISLPVYPYMKIQDAQKVVKTRISLLESNFSFVRPTQKQNNMKFTLRS